MFSASALLSALSLLAAVRAQQIGTQMAETHPTMSWQSCTASGCTTNAGSVVLDSNWRWVHTLTSTTNCYTGNTWNATICPDPVTCAENCALDGAAYAGTYGISSSGNSLKLDFVTDSANVNVGSRVYLMASNTEYQMFNLNNMEFTFTVDVSNLPCGLNGALYFSEMAADGGLSKYPNNKAGAQYGTGYCDSQCPRDIKFINGAANMLDWTPSTNDSNAGTGEFGTCCTEMDIWEANSMSAAYTAHPCTVAGQTECNGTDCGASSTSREAGFCDPDGCDFNSYRLGDTTFYGPGMTVDTTKPFEVVTQFLTADGTATGALTEIKRFYVQNNVTIPNSFVNIPGIPSTDDSITTAFCSAKIAAFNDSTSFTTKGGLAEMGQSFARGHVLVMSIWDDHAVDMLWLDSTYPTNSTALGAARGSCATTSGAPTQIESQDPGASVTYSNIKFGTINSTFTPIAGNGGGGGTTTTTTTSVKTTTTTTTTSPKTTTTTTTTTPKTTTTTTTTAPAGPTQTHWGQCAGIGYTGPTVCAAGTTCTYSNPYYSQCL